MLQHSMQAAGADALPCVKALKFVMPTACLSVIKWHGDHMLPALSLAAVEVCQHCTETLLLIS